ncbi:MAG: hypothetical protein DHS20C14_15850 [Phycisphaeraceae bacterium]|nr:MAG: hypothetical protein DHS20C14_15850 [Phycisphaeraceae bacterium]
MIGGVLGLAGFLAACIAGIAAGADPITTLWRAVLALILCTTVGALLASIGLVAVREHVAAHRERNPIPESQQPEPTTAEPAAGSGVPAQPPQPARAA